MSTIISDANDPKWSDADVFPINCNVQAQLLTGWNPVLAYSQNLVPKAFQSTKFCEKMKIQYHPQKLVILLVPYMNHNSC